MNISMRFANATYVKRLVARGFLCGALLVLPSCGIPLLRHPEAGPDLPPSYHGATRFGPDQPKHINEDPNAENSAQLGIDEFFTDPMLIGLIEQALLNNRELKILDEEVRIASNEIRARRGAYLPFVTIGATAGLDKPSLFTPLGAAEEQLEYLPGKNFPDPLGNFMGTLNFFWQLDVWRELRNARDAATQRYFAATERRNYFVTKLVAEIAENYYRLMALDNRMATLDATIDLQRKSLDSAKAKKEAGRGTELGVQRFLAEVRKNESEKLIVKQDMIEAENRINLLANRLPQPVERQASGFFDLNIQTLSLGVPAQLLQYRRDIQQAEHELAAAGLDVQVARARFFPRLDITAGVGYQAFNLKYLFYSPEALIYNVAGNLAAPLINKAAIKAEYSSANARQLQAVFNYQRVILTAFTEVVNRVSMAANYSTSIDIKKQQLESLAASVDAATKLFENARAEYVEVLLAQRDFMEAQMGLIDTKKEQLAAIVNTYQALGGGWQFRCQKIASPDTEVLAERSLPLAEEALPAPRAVSAQPD